MKYNKIITAIASVLLFGTYSCTEDWNDHYASSVMGEGTLWGTISQDPAISNFSTLLQAVGYDANLNSSQMFTVFAPTNDNFTEADCKALIEQYNAEKAQGKKDEKNTVIKEFVQNHIALYNYTVSGAMPDKEISMMNGKRLSFTNESFDGHAFIDGKYNILAGNGVLYLVDDKATYVPNIYEYITKDADLSQVRDFIYRYHEDEFSPNESVPGEIVDGKTQYLDSVTHIKNEMWMDMSNTMDTKDRVWLNAQLNDEDSIYYSVLPTNSVWDELVARNEKYFNYDKQVANRDSFMYVFPRFFALAGTQFSTTVNPDLDLALEADSVVSTNAWAYRSRKNMYGTYDAKYFVYSKPQNNIFKNVEPVECSNGLVLKATKWDVDPRSTIVQDILMEAEGKNTVDSLEGWPLTAKPIWTPRKVTTDNPFYGKVSNDEFYELTPRASVAPAVLLDFTNVLSNVKYDMYVVTAPATAYDTLAVDTKPTKFVATVKYHKETGAEVEQEISNKVTGIMVEAGDFDYDEYAFVTDPTKVHQIKIGTFIFPTASYGTDKPQVKILLDVDVTNREVTQGKFTKTLYLDCIKLVPRLD